MRLFIIFTPKVKTIKKRYKIAWFASVVLALMAFVVYGLLYTAFFQTYAAKLLAGYLQRTYNLELSINRIKIEFIKTVHLEGVTVKDLQGDTLLHAGAIAIDLESYNLDKTRFALNYLELSDVDFNLHYRQRNQPSNLDEVLALFSSGDTSTTPSTVPVVVQAKNVLLNNVNFRLKEWYDTTHAYGMDYEDLFVSRLYGRFEEVLVIDDSVMADVKLLKAREKSGFVLSQLSAQATVSSTTVDFKNLQITTPRSSIAGRYQMRYKHWRDYLDFIPKVKLDAKVDQASVYSGDVAFFAPELQNWNQTFALSGHTTGTVDRLRNRDLVLEGFSNTRFKGNFSISGLPDFDNAFMGVDADEIYTRASDVSQLVEMLTDSVFVAPDALVNAGDVFVSGSFTGFVNQFTAYGVLASDVGVIKTDLSVQQNKKDISYKGTLATEGLDVGMLTHLAQLGRVSADFDIQGEGLEWQSLQAQLAGEIQSLDYNGYTYQQVLIEGQWAEAAFDGLMACEDQNANFQFNGRVDFSQKLPEFDFSLDLGNLNLSQLNFMPDSIDAELSGQATINARGLSIAEIVGRADLKNIYYCHGPRNYRVPQATMLANQSPRELIVQSPFADLTLSGNFIPEELPNSFITVVSDAIPSLELGPKSKVKKVVKQDFTFDAKLKDLGLFREFVPDTFSFAPGTELSGFYDNTANVFEVNLKSKGIRYADFRSEALALYVKKVNDVLSVDGESAAMHYAEEYHLGKVDLLAKAVSDHLQYALSWYFDDKNQGKVEGVGLLNGLKKFNVDIFPTQLLFNGDAWNHEQTSHVEYDSTRFAVKDLVLSSGDQSVRIFGKVSPINTDRLNFELNRFNVHTIDLLYHSSGQLGGIANAKGFISNPYDNLHFEADLMVDELSYNGEVLGDLTFTSQWNKSQDAVAINGYLEHEAYKTMQINGSYTPEGSENLNIRVALNQFNLVAVNALNLEEVDRFRGYVSGGVLISGPIEGPKLKGQLTLTDAQVHIDYLNTTYTLNDKVIINPDWIGFNRMVVTDQKGNKAYATGTVNHRNFEAWNYNLYVDMQNFLCMDITADKNDLFYGIAYASGDVDISGYNDQLDIEVRAKSEKGTTVSIPLGGAEEVYAQELVRFINVARTEEPEQEVNLQGIRLKLDIEATEAAQVKLIFDEKIGDVIDGRGNGRINMEITPAGDFKMYGNYEITRGEYLFTLKNVVNKRFTVRNGGTITWFGDPYEAYVDLFAEYNASAALSDIMLTEDERYRRREQVKCIMHMTGRLMEPKIKFDINVPGADDFVRNQLAVVTNDDNELNKQFISLLVANRFTPIQNGVRTAETSTAGSAVGSNSMELLSNQLTNWLSGISRDFTVGVNLRSGDAQNTGEYSVLFGTRLFNNRVRVYSNVGVGSTNLAQQQNNPNGQNNFVGDVTVEYDISPDGRFKFKAFNQTSDNIYTSSTLSPYVQGAGISYQEQFDSLRELKENFKSLFVSKRKRKLREARKTEDAQNKQAVPK
ncbi:MAG TPA: translocation/assembly module TamB domain-containing protein [Luteibaculaceae bacterium]|nr:translocation/assembly module TamB domain-containing protein [Luteibaculaceae bacterium]